MGLPGGWGIKTKQNFIGLQHKTARPNFAKQYEPDKYRSTLTKTLNLIHEKPPTFVALRSYCLVSIFSLVNLNT